jgi:hypothetical protein
MVQGCDLWSLVLWGRLGEKVAAEVWLGRQEEAERRERNKGARVHGMGLPFIRRKND